MIIDPVTRTFNGHALVSMKSPHQATWVMKDLNEMLFVVSTGPRPLQASVAMAGMRILLLKCRVFPFGSNQGMLVVVSMTIVCTVCTVHIICYALVEGSVIYISSACIIGGPFGAMGTLENAMRVVCGDMRNRTKVATLLLINKAPQNQAQAVAHTLRRLLLQHQEQRVELKNKVNFSLNQKRWQLTIDKFLEFLPLH